MHRELLELTLKADNEREDPVIDRLPEIQADADSISTPSGRRQCRDRQRLPKDADTANNGNDIVLDAHILTLGGGLSADKRRSNVRIRRNHFDHSSTQVVVYTSTRSTMTSLIRATANAANDIPFGDEDVDSKLIADTTYLSEMKT